jgi:hypothetical protein
MHDHFNPDRFADSAGVPWEGRSFEPNEYANDAGEADPALIEAIGALRAGTGTAEAVVDAFRNARLLIPLLAALGESGEGAHGQTVDKSADLSVVTVATPDGLDGLPLFSSVAAMTAWNKDARPVPSSAPRAALAAASEGNTRIILDPGSPTEFVLRRVAIAAVAQQLPWSPPHLRQEVGEEFGKIFEPYAAIADFELQAGDPQQLLAGPELLLVLKLAPGLTQDEFDELMKAVAQDLSQSAVVADYVDSLRLKIAQAE